MRSLRRVVVALAALAALAAGWLVVAPRFNAQPDQTTPGRTADKRSADARPNDDALPRTSEELIADALKAGDLTYEESILQRAYAMFDDPRLAPAFHSPVMNWDGAAELFIEIDVKEGTLSKDLLTALAPFRARPNDPISIVNRPRKDIVKAQLLPPTHWVDREVSGTNLRIWIDGPQSDLDDYEPIFRQVWDAFPGLFRYPDADAPGADLAINPDGAIDFYIIDGNEIDPRNTVCASSRPSSFCAAPAGAVTIPTPWKAHRKSSGYVLINRDIVGDELVDTIAHELTHVSQYGYDNREEMWLKDSTASWVAYRVMKKLGRNPTLAYDRAAKFFKGLSRPLNRIPDLNPYNSWLFFLYASTELGDGIVEEVWKQAEMQGIDDVQAVNAAMRFRDHFAGFSVRNWNQDPAPQYKTWDATFRPGLVPDTVRLMMSGLGTQELDEPVTKLAAQYYYFGFHDEVRKATLQNFFSDLPDAHLWAIKKIGTDWQPPEDWSRDEQHMFCRDTPTENVTELVIIVSNSDMVKPIPAPHPKPRMLSEDVGCPYIEGSARSTFRVNDGRQDLTYIGTARLRFRPRTKQETPGVVEYDLMPTTVTWTVSGKSNNCTVTGQATVTIPDLLDQRLDISRPAQGYLKVVGADGGDWHGLAVNAYDPLSRMKVTCPTNPPSVGESRFESLFLLNITTAPNTHDGNAVAYKGTQTYDTERILDSLPGIGRGVALGFPGVADELKKVAGGRKVYTFEWDLRPIARPAAGTPPAARK